MGSTYLLHFNCKFTQDYLELCFLEGLMFHFSHWKKTFNSLHALVEGKCVVEMLYIKHYLFLFLVWEKGKETNDKLLCLCLALYMRYFVCKLDYYI